MCFPPCVGMCSWKNCAEMSVLIYAYHCLTTADGGLGFSLAGGPY